MDGVQAVLGRRSIRRYEARQVEDGFLLTLLEAAMNAPSAGNEQPWHFMVIRDRSILDSIHSIHPYSEMLPEASVAIIVCADPTLAKYPDYWIQDCSASTENILVAAHALGLGAVWLGVYPVEDRVRRIQALLGMPEHVIPFSLIPAGYPAEIKPPANRYSESRIHHDRW
jgi:nitroreductase